MVSLKHEKASKQFDCIWGNMVVRSFSYVKKKEEPKAEEDAKDRWGGLLKETSQVLYVVQLATAILYKDVASRVW